MGNAYGPLGIGAINAAPRGIAGGPRGAPAVGGGLPGLPVRNVERVPEVDVIAFYSTVGNKIRVYNKNWNEVTGTYATSQPTYGAAASGEQMWMPPRQQKYFGGGSYTGGMSGGGFIYDISAVPWALYENYTAIGHDGSGSSYIRNMAVSGYGFVAGCSASSSYDEAVCDIVTKSEVAGQPASFTSDTGEGVMKVYGDYLYALRNLGLKKYEFKTGVLVEVASGNITNGSYTCSIAAKSDHSEVYILSGSVLFVRGADLSTVLGTVDLSAYSFGSGEAVEISPDDRWLLVCGQNPVSAANGRVLLVNTESLAVTPMSIPTGSTNARMVGCAWYPDSDQYIVCGYFGARTHYGSRSAGGWIKNLYVDLFGSVGSTHGVAIITKGRT